MNYPTEQIHAFATGYLQALHEHHTDPSDTDTWIWGQFGKYDLNLVGTYYSSSAPDNGLLVVVYPTGWGDCLPEHLFTLTVNAI